MKKWKLPRIIDDIASKLKEVGGYPLLVGGCVRDHLLGIPHKDFDIEVFHIDSFTILKKALKPFGVVKEVGKQFGVIKLFASDLEIDFSFPRKDIKIAKGHRGFDVQIDPALSYEQAALRRDFTINSMAYDPFLQKMMDPYHGQRDLQNRVLRHIGPAFSEDPLRVYRAMQFGARFECDVHPSTIALCRSIDLSELPKERIFEEFSKLLLKAHQPSLGLQTAVQLGIVDYFPELKALIGVPQDPKWHPEGDVWQHTLNVVDAMATLKTQNPKKDLIFMFAALCHDFGKAETTQFLKDRWRSYGHEKAGGKLAETFLCRLTHEQSLIHEVKKLVKDHLKPFLLYEAAQHQKVTDTAIRRLSTRVNIQDLLRVAEADSRGKGGTPSQAPSEIAIWLQKRAEQLHVSDSQPKPLLTGKILMAQGFSSGPIIGKILKAVYEKQLEGELHTPSEAMQWVKTNEDYYLLRKSG